MKNAIIYFSLISLFFFFSCGGPSQNKNVPEDKTAPEKKVEKTKTENASLSTQEGMTSKLLELGIKIPEFYVFNEVTNKDGEYSISYKFNPETGSIGLAQTVIDAILYQMKTQIGWKEKSSPATDYKTHTLSVPMDLVGSATKNLVISYYLGGNNTLGDDPKSFFLTFKYFELN
ncbi:MAG TPA: hypothetical protein VMV47_08300 [Bacteroidales bacterium]|nr:hypothetical protein [Bacteroidales bacterium]